MLYHVTPKWDGLNLESLYTQFRDESYDIYLNKWPDAGSLVFDHVQYIHLHADIKEAEAFQKEFGGEILEIDDTDLDVEYDTLEYSHPMVRGYIESFNVRRHPIK